ncbi:MAG: hypothetical protein M3552_05650 [Planctomycetota bacterium]|nr:hypothetical protein [Planctomycetaceae bacterium]MDQ3330121.1 hypothetical protein [Planctomycetota bacterium]
MSSRPVAAFVVVCALFGCKSRPEARYVVRSSDMGVIAMSKDTPENRERAFALMQSHFPEGYDVICEGEEAVVAPLPNPTPHMPGDALMTQRVGGYSPGAAAYWNEPAFQQQVESLPGTPQSMRGYAQPPAPSVGVRIGDPPARPTGVVRSEWRITYRRRDGQSGSGTAEPQSLFPEYHRTP